jgi:glycosyltransferase involved in cell wall biosynthesis
MISVLILTKNEESNIERCINSVSISNDIVVYDSHSDDQTVEIAKRLGARVVQRQFDNWSSHQNWAVANIDFKHPWVYYTDADEICDLQLCSELEHIEKIGEGFAAFQLRRKDYFMGRWLKRSQLYPTWITRVFRPEKIRYERLVNPVAIVAGKTGTLNGHIIHYPFSHGVGHWLDRHNKYSDFEARDLIKEVCRPIKPSDLFAMDAATRRRSLKALAYRIPGRPLLMFTYLYLFRRGLLDGKPGFYYSILRAMYESMIDLKVAELRHGHSGPVPESDLTSELGQGSS